MPFRIGDDVDYELLSETMALATKKFKREIDKFQSMSALEQDEYLDSLEKLSDSLNDSDRALIITRIEEIRSSADRMSKKEALGCITFALFFGAAAGPGGIGAAGLGCAIGAANGAL